MTYSKLSLSRILLYLVLQPLNAQAKLKIAKTAQEEKLEFYETIGYKDKFDSDPIFYPEEIF